MSELVLEKEKQLPENWISTSLGDVVIPIKGKKPKILGIKSTELSTPYIDIKAFEKNEFEKFTTEKTCPKCSESDVLIVWDGSRSGLVGTGVSGVIGSTLSKLYCFDIEKKYLFYFLRMHYDKLNKNPKGIGIPHVNPDVLWSFNFPIPPLNEQKRIVSKIQELFSLIEHVEQTIHHLQIKLFNYRRSFLNSALEGEFTHKWREDNASKLKPIQPTFTKNYPKKIEHTNEHWIISPIESVVDKIVDCPHSTPKWSSTGKICLRTSDFNPFKLVLDNIRYVDEKTFDERNSRLKPMFGDVLYSREGSILGIACQILDDVNICLGQRMMLFRCFKNISGKFLTALLNSEIILKQVQKLTTGTASAHLNVRDIKCFQIPVPSMSEQLEISSLIDSQFNELEKQNKLIKNIQNKLIDFKKIILKQAFEGKLVPQDPNDEPTEIPKFCYYCWCFI